METAFYDDGRYVPSSNNKEEVRKRLTLDLNSPRLKKARFDVLLSSPDLNMLKLPSPELEKLIMQQNGLLSATPTPGGFVYPTPTGNNNQQGNSSSTNNTNNPRAGVTRDQELYARGFDDALAELHQAHASTTATSSNNNQQQQPQQQHHSMVETGSTNAPFSGLVSNRPPASSSPYAMNPLPALQVTITTLSCTA